MLDKIPGLKRFKKIVKDWDKIAPFSTGQKVVDFSEPLYNIIGSTEDPKSIPGAQGDSWKKLLEDAGIGESGCYVTDPLPSKKSSHPKFLVGGHMTPNKDGIVSKGADSYLMPLCKWHNSTSRNGIPFSHKETRMIKLSGYMQGELASTYLMRQPSNAPFSLAFFDLERKVWMHQNLSEQQAIKLNSSESIFDRKISDISPAYILIRRKDEKLNQSPEELSLPDA